MGDLQIVVAAGKNVEAQYVEMMVPLYSYGCAKKIKKALANLKGIYSVNVKYQQQKVTVWGICDKQDVLSIVQKKRKGARFWDAEIDHQPLDHQDYSSHSAPPSPSSSDNNDESAIPTRGGRRDLAAMIKRQGSSLRLNLSLIKTRSLNWHKAVLNKAFARSNSF